MQAFTTLAHRLCDAAMPFVTHWLQSLLLRIHPCCHQSLRRQWKLGDKTGAATLYSRGRFRCCFGIRLLGILRGP